MNEQAKPAQSWKNSVRSSSVGPDVRSLRYMEWPPASTSHVSGCRVCTHVFARSHACPAFWQVPQAVTHLAKPIDKRVLSGDELVR